MMTQLIYDVTLLHKQHRDELVRILYENRFDAKDLNVTVEPPNLMKVEHLISQLINDMRHIQKDQFDELVRVVYDSRIDLKDLKIPQPLPPPPPDTTKVEQLISQLGYDVKGMQN